MNPRPEVQRFAELMEWKLRANNDKPGFHLMSLRNIIERMREEAMELLAEGQRESSLDEAIDVANFAAFGRKASTKAARHTVDSNGGMWNWVVHRVVIDRPSITRKTCKSIELYQRVPTRGWHPRSVNG